MLKNLDSILAAAALTATVVAGCGDDKNTTESGTDTETTDTASAGCPTAGCPTTETGTTAGCPTTGCPTAGCPTAGCPTAACPTAGCPTTGCPTTGCPTTACPTTACPTTGCPTTACPTTGCPSTDTDGALLMETIQVCLDGCSKMGECELLDPDGVADCESKCNEITEVCDNQAEVNMGLLECVMGECGDGGADYSACIDAAPTC